MFKSFLILNEKYVIINFQSFLKIFFFFSTIVPIFSPMVLKKKKFISIVLFVYKSFVRIIYKVFCTNDYLNVSTFVSIFNTQTETFII